VELPEISLVAFDPGDNTGVAEIQKGKLIETYTLSYNEILQTVEKETSPWLNYPLWVIEDYRVYPWAVGGFDKAYSARVIGMLEVLGHKHNIGISFQMASEVKQMFKGNMKKIMAQCWDITKTKTKHETEAVQHAFLHLIKGKGG